MADLLFEIGLEEVPARMIAAAQAELERRMQVMLVEQGLLESSVSGFTTGTIVHIKSYSTPRRLAIIVRGVRLQQEDVTAEVTGPAVKIAYKDGQPTPAAEAFARKSGVSVEELRTITTPKGEYLSAVSIRKGRSASEVIAAELPKEVGAIYWAKNMYWREGKPERFVRPVLWLLCLLGEEIVPVSFGGKTAGRATFGHRVLASGEPFEIESPESYEAQLAGEYVLVDVEARRHKIRKALDHVTREVAGARWREDEALVDQVTHLTEWPTVLLGNFEPEYLALPEEVLVTVMRDHQKYFAVEDAEGKLAPHFLTVLNISTDENSAAIIRQGNERVLRARFNDARFFWEFDQRVPLAERVKLLENVTFQKDLGSYAAKSERVRRLCHELANCGNLHSPAVNVNAILDAAALAKTDLTTELVKEFTELQGIIGGLYAKDQGLSQTTCDAIYDQYMPASMDDRVPRSIEGAVLGIADRADTIAGMFGLGLEPTGSKDPFALRRAANGIVKILGETELPLTLDRISGLAAKDEGVAKKMTAFFRERVEFYLREVRGQAYDVVASVLASGADDVQDVIARAEAITVVRNGEDFAAISAALKRMKNILAKADEVGEFKDRLVVGGTAIEIELADLWDAAIDVRPVIEKFVANRDYVGALRAIAKLRPQVDDFFDKVMILHPDPIIRRGRLLILWDIVQNLKPIADLSEIVTSGQ